MREDSPSEAMEAATAKDQTAAELMYLGTLKNTHYWPALRRVVLRLKDSALAQMESPDTPVEGIRVAQGKMRFANELIDFVEREAPSAYERHQDTHDDDSEPDTQDA